MRFCHADQNVKSLQKYRKILELKSKSTQKLFETTINNLERFGGFNLENFQKYDEDSIYDTLQEWVVWNNKRGTAASTIICYLNAFRSILWYFGIKLDREDIRRNITFPRILHQEHIPLSPKIFKKILLFSNYELKFQLLALISSGMRAGELGMIRAAYLDFTYPNITVKIPAHITKTGRSRTTFFSKQVSSMIRLKTHDVGLANFSFCGNRTTQQSRDLILKRFSVARKKAGLLEKHDHCNQNRYIIHVHSLRSYFITKANKIQFGLGHILAGHGFYMKEYNQYTDEEMLHMYGRFEEALTF